MPHLLGLFLTLLLSVPSLAALNPAQDEKDRIRIARIESQISKSSLTFLLSTAAIHQDTFNRPFGSFGNMFLLSIPVTQLGETLWLHAEGGMGLTFSKVTLTQPDTSFTHLEFPFPLTGRLLFSISRKVFGDVFAGIIYRPFFYDSRDSTNGGFQALEEGKFKPELGIGLGFFLTRSLRMRLRVSYFSLSAGLELIL